MHLHPDVERQLGFATTTPKDAQARIAFGDWNRLLEQPADNLPALLELRAIELNVQSRYTEAAQAAAKLRELDNVDKDQLYNAARVFSRCAASIKPEDGAKVLTAEKVKQRQAWIDDALASLRHAIAAGYKDFDHMQKDADLASLRSSPEFEIIIPSPASPEPEKTP